MEGQNGQNRKTPLEKGVPDDVAVGMAWYRADQWDALRMVSSDGEDLEDTFREWEEHASVKFEELRKAGVNVQKVDVDLPKLVAWCRARGVPVDGDSRSDYAVDKMHMPDDASD